MAGPAKFHPGPTMAARAGNSSRYDETILAWIDRAITSNIDIYNCSILRKETERKIIKFPLFDQNVTWFIDR